MTKMKTLSIAYNTDCIPESWHNSIADCLAKSRHLLRVLPEHKSGMTGWCGVTDAQRHEALSLLKGIEQFRRDLPVPYDTVVVVGIGGSYLGTRAVWESFRHPLDTVIALNRGQTPPIIPLFMGQNLSEADIIKSLDFLEGRRPLINIISKSGTTTEPAIAFRILRHYMEKRFGKDGAKERIIATTDPEHGALRQLASQEGYQTFSVPANVGGRYSVFSAVGLLPLKLMGLDIKGFTEGAAALFREVQETDNHAALHYAAIRQVAFTEGKRIEVLSFSDPRLSYLSEWWKQLFGESHGKSGLGLFPAGLLTTTDLHSLGQYMQDGCRNIIETFLQFEECFPADDLSTERRLKIPGMSPSDHEAQGLRHHSADQLDYLAGKFVEDINFAATAGTRKAHLDGGVPNSLFQLKKLDEYHLGYVMAFFMVSCAVSGMLLGVDPFDQPGVEAYKKELFQILGKPVIKT